MFLEVGGEEAGFALLEFGDGGADGVVDEDVFAPSILVDWEVEGGVGFDVAVEILDGEGGGELVQCAELVEGDGEGEDEIVEDWGHKVFHERWKRKGAEEGKHLRAGMLKAPEFGKAEMGGGRR